MCSQVNIFYLQDNLNLVYPVHAEVVPVLHEVRSKLLCFKFQDSVRVNKMRFIDISLNLETH